MNAAVFPMVPDWLRILLTLLMLVGGVVFGLALLRAALIVATIAAQAAWEGLQRFTVCLSDFFIKLVLGIVAIFIGALLTAARALWWMGCHMATGLTSWAFKPFAVRLERRRQRAALYRLWSEEYQDQFPDFDDFLKAFARSAPHEDEARCDAPHGSTQPPPRPKPRPASPPAVPPDPRRLAFVAACHVLGLPDSGAFTLQQLTNRYRIRISAAHPDRGGNAQRAAALNAARDLIKSAKGWS